MTKKEIIAVTEFKGSVLRALNLLKWYASDYDNATINNIAENLSTALDDFNLKIK